MTEHEKRELDAFRMRDKHPAVQLEDLPDEVRDYIIGLEIQVYDFKQDRAFNKPILASILGAAFIFLSYKDIANFRDFGYIFGGLCLIVPWFFYSRESRKNEDEMRPAGAIVPTDEGIRVEWEMSYLVNHRKKDEPN